MRIQAIDLTLIFNHVTVFFSLFFFFVVVVFFLFFCCCFFVLFCFVLFLSFFNSRILYFYIQHFDKVHLCVSCYVKFCYVFYC